MKSSPQAHQQRLSTGIPAITLALCFGTQLLPAAPRSAKPIPAIKLAPPEMHRDSARFFTEEQRNDFIALTAEKLGMSKREMDPFALPQDPDAKPKQTITEIAQAQPAAAEKVPFADIINRIRITAIIPREKQFMINARPYDEGSELRLNFQGDIIRAQVVSIRANAIVMRNLETNEVATLRTQLLPQGMQLGKGGNEAAELFQSEQDAPIILDEAENFEE